MSLSRFQRMVAVPEEEYQQLKSLRAVHDPLQDKFVSLANDYNRQGFIDNVHTRVQRQGETLNAMIKMKNDLSKRIIDATPKPYQKRAQSLFNFLREKLDVNEKGELLDKTGQPISGSHIGDLIQHAVRDRQRKIVPVGWERFLTTLQDENAPRMILNYNTLDEMRRPKTYYSKPQSPKSPIHSPHAFTFDARPKIKPKKKTSPPDIQEKPNPFSVTPSVRKSDRRKKKPVVLRDYLGTFKDEYV